MNIAILIDEYVSGAMPGIARNEKKALKKLGFDCEILTCTKFTELPKDIKYIFPNLPKWRFPMFSFFSPQHLINILFAKRLKYDRIIAHGFFSALIAVHSGAKVDTVFWDPTSTMIYKIYGHTWLKFLVPIATFMDKYVAKKSNQVILGSRYHSIWFHLHKIPFKVVYPGCKPAKSIQKKKLNYVLAIDRWDKGSTPIGLLKSLNGEKLVVAGKWIDKKIKQEFLDEVKRLGVKVKLLGYVSDVKRKYLMRNAKRLVHPTKDSFGMQGIEAAAQGCPIDFKPECGVLDIIPNLSTPTKTWKAAKQYTWTKHVTELICE